MNTFLEIIAVLFLVFLNGFFVGSEFALVSVRRPRIETLAASGSRQAKRLLGMLNNLTAYISAVQLGVTLASLGLGIIGEQTFARLLEQPLEGRVSDFWRNVIASGIAYLILTTLHIVLGELVPKTIALESAEKVALLIALPMQFFYKVFRLPITILSIMGGSIVRLLGFKGSNDHASIYTEDEIRQLVEISHKSGHLEAGEQQLINRIFDFSEAEVREAMVPRMAVAALPVTASLEEAESSFCSLGYSRLPVYRDQLDNIVGVLFMKELLPCLRRQDPTPFDLENLLHPPMFVPATAKLGSVLAQMQGAQTHIAFVIDEHGGIEGIVTLEDLLEEIVGEINDEYDEEVRQQIVKEDGSYLVDGMLAVRDANRHFDLKIPEEAGYTTLAGFMLSQAGRLLLHGEAVDYDGARFTVERMDHRRIRRIRFKPAPKENGNGTAQTPAN